MNSTSDYSNTTESPGGFAYGIGISLGVLVLIVFATLASYVCTRIRMTPPLRSSSSSYYSAYASRNRSDSFTAAASFSIELGLDEATLRTFPKLLYSQTDKVRQGGSVGTCCAICLSNYKERDELRLLPDCGHYFHSKCVDPWLRLNPTCPNCRKSPIPTPLATPLAEVAPFTVHVG